MFRNWIGAGVAVAFLLSTTAAYAGSADQGALAPGKAAGVKQAQMMDDDTALWLIGGAIVIGGIILVATGTGNGTTTVTTNNTTVRKRPVSRYEFCRVSSRLIDGRLVQMDRSVSVDQVACIYAPSLQLLQRRIGSANATERLAEYCWAGAQESTTSLVDGLARSRVTRILRGGDGT